MISEGLKGANIKKREKSDEQNSEANEGKVVPLGNRVNLGVDSWDYTYSLCNPGT